MVCFLEHDAEGVLEVSLRALTFARALSAPSGRVLVGAILGAVSPAARDQLSACGVSDAFELTLAGLDGYAPAGWARALLDLIETWGADALVAAGTDRGNEVMAHVGAISGLPMVANCLYATWRDTRSINLSRQRWAGSLIEDAVLEGVPVLLTVAPDGVVAEPSPTTVATTLHQHRVVSTDADRRVRVNDWTSRGGGVALADARVVVGGGRGVGSEEGFAALDELADLLGGAVGVSRAVTSAGWRPHAQQVGQTGTKISPELYLVCGISGATQHLAGCRGAKRVVAINTDPDAPILSRADFAIVGDIAEIVPALVAVIRERA